MTAKPLILAVETSSRIGSIALAIGPDLLAQTPFSGPMKHSAELFGAVAEMLARFGRKPRQIDQVFISAGPGSFTGLRIAVTTAKMMHLAAAAKIVAVDTLDVIASNVTDYIHSSPQTAVERIATVLDGKRGRFFIAVYGLSDQTRHRTEKITHEHYLKIVPDCLMTASQFLDRFATAGPQIHLLGDGLLYHADKFNARGIQLLEQRYWSPQAKNVHLLGWKIALQKKFADPLTLTPCYLRGPQIGQSRLSPKHP
ncbi:MAG: tRNA (adenosine(37)-N6)-threonylcarbamoyltransferase complex dimerization subunit type 1 TsaB [Phycisphaerales bacterium]|nr:MAG: tRNA (adenosine(37)-N6)-threonylcarbamoyltransferase complex dimerization subunit type 1 TsaB [Phycisphaerales bacterium]